MTDRSTKPSILVVCTGNICRSAMADVILTDRAAKRGLDVVIDSAGISDEEAGNPIDDRAQRVLRDAGYEIPWHAARQVKSGELADYDLVLAMTDRHRAALYRIAERDGVGADNIRMWREFDPSLPEGTPVGTDLDVPDPWYGGHEDFLDTLEVVEGAADNVLDAVTDAR
ncbi:protein tyrosine phosphatase [Bowdeniella nasicola]|uniref:protein-tyrosine-phosphatase n=1 Tax=Bowdeniella nasicola TaxID=208480 RepID=A0A1Q5Q1C2_9ACTO|nr:low molecular weight protein-tyrosine-phosphatase [Bowdeniella nasicola]OKL53505.1 protein tyrosine phosphatase [Bowdeniella nasicola]